MVPYAFPDIDHLNNLLQGIYQDVMNEDRLAEDLADGV
jgi:hypothetical protein